MFMLGNHEPMVLANDLRYTKEKYKILAEKLKIERTPGYSGPDYRLQMVGNP